MIKLTQQSIASGGVDDTVDQILALENAELVLQSTGGTITADGTEQTLLLINEPLGCFNGLAVYVNLDNMAGGDTTVFRVYYRIADAGDLEQQDYQSYTGADGGLANGNTLIKIDLGPNRHGIWVTMDQTAGVNRDYPYEVFIEA